MKCTYIIGTTGAVLVLAATLLWYTRPMPLEQLCPGIDLSKCTEIKGKYVLPDLNTISISLTPEDPAFASLLAQFQDRIYRRSVRNLLPSSMKTHIGYLSKDTKWEVYLDFDTLTLPNGKEASGTLIWFENFFDSVDIHFAGQAIQQEISTTDEQQWLLDVQTLLIDTAIGRLVRNG